MYDLKVGRGVPVSRNMSARAPEAKDLMGLLSALGIGVAAGAGLTAAIAGAGYIGYRAYEAIMDAIYGERERIARRIEDINAEIFMLEIERDAAQKKLNQLDDAETAANALEAIEDDILKDMRDQGTL